MVYIDICLDFVLPIFSYTANALSQVQTSSRSQEPYHIVSTGQVLQSVTISHLPPTQVCGRVMLPPTPAHLKPPLQALRWLAAPHSKPENSRVNIWQEFCWGFQSHLLPVSPLSGLKNIISSAHLELWPSHFIGCCHNHKTAEWPKTVPL